jgi:hypothetical protein
MCCVSQYEYEYEYIYMLPPVRVRSLLAAASSYRMYSRGSLVTPMIADEIILILILILI